MTRWGEDAVDIFNNNKNRSLYFSLLYLSSVKVGRGAVDTSDDDGWTPLIIAASAGHNQLVEMLLANGANVNATTSQVEIVKYTFFDCRRQCNNHL